jgi:DNA modification methylase
MSRAIGDEFEDLIYSILGDINKTTNSGAKYNNGDFSNHDYIIEAKVKSSFKKFKVVDKELDKLKSQASMRLKDWIYIQRTQDGDQVLMDLGTFSTLWKALHNK